MMGRVEAARGAEGDSGRFAAGSPAVPHPALDRIVALAADLFAAPVACLALRRRERAIVVSTIGLRAGLRPLAWDFPLSEPAPLAVSDLAADVRVTHHPPVTDPPPRFFVGAPVAGPDGVPFGTLCVMAPEPRPDPAPADMGRLAALAVLAGDAIEAHRARERAEAAAEARAGLLADVSHEMRTPLNAIVGFTQLLGRDAALAGEARRAVERIDEAGRGLLNIVGDALDLSRFESGLVRLDPRSFSPTRLVEDAAAMLRAEAERKGLRLVVNLPAGASGPLVGDPDRLRQVLLNLLSNAVKFTDAGSVVVRLGLDRLTAAGPVLRVEVTDTGAGIPLEVRSRLFESFSQGDSSTTREYGGTGLGLATCQRIARAHGGQLMLAETPGGGLTVVVELPDAPS